MLAERFCEHEATLAGSGLVTSGKLCYTCVTPFKRLADTGKQNKNVPTTTYRR
jgi:hypothetical protein